MIASCHGGPIHHMPTTNANVMRPSSDTPFSTMENVPSQISSQSSKGDERHEPTVIDAGDEVQRDGNAADFRCQHQQVDEQFANQQERKVSKAAALADRIDERMMTDAGEPPGHLGQQHHAQRADREHPEHLQPKAAPASAAVAMAPTSRKPPMLADDAERDVHDALHSWPSRPQRVFLGGHLHAGGMPAIDRCRAVAASRVGDRV